MRIRTVKPEWLDDEKMALASAPARVASIALILLADDHGCGRGNEELLSARIFPGDSRTIQERLHVGRAALAELCEMGFVRFYRVRGQRYFQVVNWQRHQRVDKVGKPRNPLPSSPDAVYETKVGEIYGKTRETPEKIREARETLATDLGPTTKDLDHDQRTTPPRPPSSAAGASRSPRSPDRDRPRRPPDREPESVDLAEFKRWRTAWGIRQQDIATALHCKRTQYSTWERRAEDCPDHIRRQLAQYRKRIEGHDADKRHELAATAIAWLNDKTEARYRANSDLAQSAARQWLRWGWTADRLICALERASAGLDKPWWRPKTLFQLDRLRTADEENQANAPVAHFGQRTSKQTPTVGYAEPSHPDEFIGGKRDLGPILDKMKRGEQP